MLALFADDAEVTAAPGTLRGKAAIWKFFEWDAWISPAVTIRDTGLGVLVVGRSVVWERHALETAEGVPFREEAVTILEFDDADLIRRYRSLLRQSGILAQITSGMSSIYGWLTRELVAHLVALGRKGLDTPSARPSRAGLRRTFRSANARPRRALGWSGPGFAPIAHVVVSVPGSDAREATHPVFPGKTCQRRQRDDAGDHVILEAAVPQKTCHRIQFDPEHDYAVLTAGRPRSIVAASRGDCSRLQVGILA